MIRYLSVTLSAAAFLLWGQVAPAQAGAILYSDRTAFNQAVGNSTFLDFEEPTKCLPLPYDPGTCTATYGGLIQFWYDHVGFPVPPGENMPHAIPYGLGSQQVVTVLFEPVMAIGFDLRPVTPGARVQFGSQTYDLDQPQFFGFLFDSPLTGVVPLYSLPLLDGQSLGPSGQSYVLSQFTLDNLAVQTIPEPATLLTFGATASLLLGLRRRRAR
jgi:hypothetical protein